MSTKSRIKSAGLNLPDIPLEALLSFLKDTRGAVNWSAKDLRECLKLNAKQAEELLAILEMQGYVAKDGEQWLTTAAGESISNSKKPQFTLASVAGALDTLTARIKTLNLDRRGEFKITKAVAFGDFLAGRSQAQAADVGVELSRRDPIAGHPEEEDEETRRVLMNELRRKSRLFAVQKYRPWMSQRRHRDLL